MQIVPGYILNEILAEGILIPTGDDENQRDAYCLNETGYFMLKKMEQGCERGELLNAVLETFDVEREIAEQAVTLFLTKLDEYHLLKNMN